MSIISPVIVFFQAISNQISDLVLRGIEKILEVTVAADTSMSKEILR